MTARAFGALLGWALLSAAGAVHAQPRQAPPPPRPYPPYYRHPGYPPPYGYPPPRGYPRPHYGPPAAPPAPSGPPAVVYGWDPAVPAPDGYRVDSIPNGRLLGVGIGLLSAGYVTSLVAGAVAARAEEEEELDEIDAVQPSDLSPMFIPIGGPFATIFTIDAGPATTGLLIANGLVQVGGVVSIIVGSVDRSYRVVRTRTAIDVVPTPGGAMIRGAF